MIKIPIERVHFVGLADKAGLTAGQWLLWDNNRPTLIHECQLLKSNDLVSHCAPSFSCLRFSLEIMIIQKKASQAFEAQTAQEEMTAAELEELAVRKRRAEGTPCNKENFEAWNARFQEEMEQKAQQLAEEAANEGGNQKKKAASTAANAKDHDRITGFEYFSNKTNNYEALELAAEQAGEQEGNNDGDGKFTTSTGF